MIDYIYDGTFDGLLTVVYHHYYTDKAFGISTPERYQTNLLYPAMEIVTDPAKSDRVYQAIRRKISEYDLRGVYRAWLSCDPRKEMKILRYIELGFRQGHRTSSLHGDPVVADFQAILKKISQESERMLQFVRFSVVDLPQPVQAAAGEAAAGTAGSCERVDGKAAAGEESMRAGERWKRQILYAQVQPDNDVIELAAPHFCDRFHNERLIIHDVGRGKAVVAWRGHWMVTAFAPEQIPRASARERECRQLWKQYFDHIAIMERKNTRCQNNFIPLRYRKHLTEFTADAPV